MQEYIIQHSGSTTLITLNDEMEDIMKIVKSPGDSGLLLKEIIKTIQNEVKERNGRFLITLLGNLLSGKGIIRATKEKKLLISAMDLRDL